MPTYAYACKDCGHNFEIVQSFSDDALSVCPNCEGNLRKVFNSVGVVFKGSGFYRNDSRDKKSSTSPAASGGAASSTSSESKSADAKPAASASEGSTKSTASTTASTSGSSTKSSGTKATGTKAG